MFFFKIFEQLGMPLVKTSQLLVFTDVIVINNLFYHSLQPVITYSTLVVYRLTKGKQTLSILCYL